MCAVRRPAAQNIDLADLLALHVSGMQLPRGVREFVPFPNQRKFRCDLAWPAHKLCAEVNGGEYTQGRHARAAGMNSDYEKHALLVLDGWQVFWFSGSQVKSGFAIDILQRWFASHSRPLVLRE